MRRVPTVIATSYQTSLRTGRTTPSVFICEDANGNSVGEYVVKLRENVETGNAGLLREIVGSLLADQLGIVVPEPAIVTIPIDLSPTIPDQIVANALGKSLGSNFGCRYLSGGYVIWPKDKAIPLSLKQMGIDIFVFDALIQNPDRRREKPNVLWRSDELVAIDHEMAFSFLLDILPSREPWLLADQAYLSDHIFFQHLRHMDNDLKRITRAIEVVTAGFWSEVDRVVPDEWKGQELDKIRVHFESVQQHLEDFVKSVRSFLQ